MAYQSKFTGAEVDSLLEQVQKGEVGGSVTVDSSLSTTSENPVMNKAITEEINKKLEGEVIGTTSPTEGTVSGSYDDTEIREQLTELSAEVGEVSEAVEGKEDKGNKTTSLSASSTDVQYPSAKAVFMAVSRKSEAKAGVVRQTQNWTQAADKGYDYTITDVVRGAIPQANIDLLNSCGVVFNKTSGYFEVNGLTDITYEEAMAIYNKTNVFAQGCLSPSGVGLGGVMIEDYGAFRSNVPLLPYRYYMLTQGSLTYLFWNNRFIEHISFANYSQFYAKDFASVFDGCYRLKEVQGIIELKNSSTSYASAFLNCYSLESISLQGIKGNLDFKQSARLSNASILFMIEKSVATSAIVITLHADAYDRAMADSAIQTALANKTFVSLAKA